MTMSFDHIMMTRTGLVFDLISFLIMVPVVLGPVRFEKFVEYIKNRLEKPQSLFLQMTDRLSDELLMGEGRITVYWMPVKYLVILSIAFYVLLLLIKVVSQLDFSTGLFVGIAAIFGIVTSGLLLIYNSILFVATVIFIVTNLLNKLLLRISKDYLTRWWLWVAGGLAFTLGIVFQILATY